jgi:hypothetical protein
MLLKLITSIKTCNAEYFHFQHLQHLDALSICSLLLVIQNYPVLLALNRSYGMP